MQFNDTRLFGVRVTATTLDTAADAIIELARRGAAHTVCVANVDMVTRAVSNLKLRELMERSFVVLTDGMPLVWILHRQGHRWAERVYGPHLMRRVCERAATERIPIFLFGGTRRELGLLQDALLELYPALEIVGAVAPPVLPLDPPHDQKIIDAINRSRARIVFVGLGCPKQEHWMANHRDGLNAVAIGVGLAFAQIARLQPEAPRWMQRSGLEWAFRLSREPRRLWRRYAIGNTRFVWYFAREAWRHVSREST